MEDFETKLTIGAIAVAVGGRESPTELAGSTLVLAPVEIELGPEELGADMGDFETKLTIGAIAVAVGGRESPTELAGSTLVLAPVEIKLGPEELDSKIPLSTIGPVIPGLGLVWVCLEQVPASKTNGLVNGGPEQPLTLPNQTHFMSNKYFG